MNWKQKIALWLGIAAFVLVGLSLPSKSNGVFGTTADINQIYVGWAIVAVVTGGLIITFKDRKRKDD